MRLSPDAEAWLAPKGPCAMWRRVPEANRTSGAGREMPLWATFHDAIVGSRLGIDPSAMSNIERGRRSVKTDELMKKKSWRPMRSTAPAARPTGGSSCAFRISRRVLLARSRRRRRPTGRQPAGLGERRVRPVRAMRLASECGVADGTERNRVARFRKQYPARHHGAVPRDGAMRCACGNPAAAPRQRAQPCTPSGAVL